MPAVRKLPLILLGLMTLPAFLGPFAIALVLRGGPHAEWPPDRPVEWITFLSIVGLVAALMLACLSLAVLNRRDQLKRLGDLNPDRDSSS